MTNKKFLGKPNVKQQEFFVAKNRFIAYGGSRGGGKSWAVRKKAILLALRYSGIKIMILRRSFTELRENHIRPLQAEISEIASYKELEKAFTFANESRIKFGYCDSENDVLQYQGQEFDVIFLDEATQLTEFQFKTLTACLRGANKFPKRMYITCNPGGVGHGWVKRLFIDCDYKDGENASDYLFIPARVYDNKALMQTDTGYVDMLKSLPIQLRRAWLEGDWNVFAGQYFSEWREEIHVCEPFAIPTHWRRYFAMDYGLDMLAGYFFAVDETGKAYVYREIYQSNLVVSAAAQAIKNSIPYGEKITAYYAPPDMYNRRQDTGKSVAELFLEQDIPLTKVSNERVAGWLEVKEWLKIFEENGNKTAFLQVFKGCTNLIRCMPLLQFDAVKTNDVSDTPHEITHAPDALRYFISARPLPTQPQCEPDEFVKTEDEQWQQIFDYSGF